MPTNRVDCSMTRPPVPEAPRQTIRRDPRSSTHCDDGSPLQAGYGHEVSIQRVIDADAVGALTTRGKASLPDIEIDAVFELGVVLDARALWEDLGIGEAIRTRLMPAHPSAPPEMALF